MYTLTNLGVEKYIEIDCFGEEKKLVRFILTMVQYVLVRATQLAKSNNYS